MSLRAFRRSRKLISSPIISAARSSTFLRSAGLSFQITSFTFTDMVTSPSDKQIQLNYRERYRWKMRVPRNSRLEVRASCHARRGRQFGALRARGGAPRPDFKLHALRFLQVFDDLKQIFRLGIAMRPEHPHQTLCGTMRDFAQLVESHGCLDEIAQNDLAGFNVAGEKVFDPLAQERLAKTGIALNARPDGFFIMPCQRHCSLRGQAH